MLDRVILTKFFTHRVSLQSSHANFPKTFCLAKNGGLFEFSNFCANIAKHKNTYISKTLLDRAISMKFLTHRVSLQSSHANFQKKIFSQKMAAILNFRIFRKIAKHKNAYISKTLLDRAISMKFFTHRVSLQSSHANFPKKICLAKNGGHFEFSNFCTNIAKHKNTYISKTLLDRAISMKFLTHWVSLQSNHANFQKKIFSPKMAAILNFRIFRTNCKT